MGTLGRDCPRGRDTGKGHSRLRIFGDLKRCEELAIYALKVLVIWCGIERDIQTKNDPVGMGGTG